MVDIDNRYEALRKSCRGGMGQKGTTEPWQNPARVLTGIHGPCWLAAEIAIAGAANRSLLASGSFDKGGEPFGPHVDYGTFVLAVHNRPDLDWWGSMYERYPDSLSRRTWALALITCADTDVVAHYLASIDSTWSALNNDEFYAVASSSSRLALSQSRHQLDDTIWDSAHGLGQRTLLLVAHFAADLAAADPLTVLSDEQLEQLASPMVATWPVARAINTRMFSTPNATLLSALSKLGAGPLGDAPQGAKFDPDEYAAAILNEPGRFPPSWVLEAERLHSMGYREVPLEVLALEKQWLPKIPRL